VSSAFPESEYSIVDTFGIFRPAIRLLGVLRLRDNDFEIFYNTETHYPFQVIFFFVMTSTEEDWSFPDTLEGFGYTFNAGSRSIDFLKIKDLHRWICEI